MRPMKANWTTAYSVRVALPMAATSLILVFQVRGCHLRPSSMHFMQIFAVKPAPDRISWGVSFRQTLQNRRVRGSGSGLEVYPGQ